MRNDIIEGEMMTNLMGAWEKLTAAIDDDMMLIYPEMYIENQDMFDDIVGIGYLVKDMRDPENSLDWVKEHHLYKLLSKGTPIAVISKLMIVRLRLPWNRPLYEEWSCGKKELEDHGDEYEVLDTYIWASHKGGKPHLISLDERQYFDEHRNEYTITDIQYRVRWKFSEDEIDDILASPFVDDTCVAHVYVEDREFWEDYFKEKETGS